MLREMLVSDREIFIFNQSGDSYILDSNSQMFWRISNELICDRIDLEQNCSKLMKFGFFERSKDGETLQKIHQFDLENLVINPSTKCNLDCWFCYADKDANYNNERIRLHEIKTIIMQALEFKIKNKSKSPLLISLFLTSEITLDFDSFFEIWQYVEGIKSEYKFPIHILLPPTNLMDLNDRFTKFVDNYGFLTVSLDLENTKQWNNVITNLKHFRKDVIKHCIIPLNSSNKNLFDTYTNLLSYFEQVSMRPVRIPQNSRYPWTKESIDFFGEELKILVNKLLELPDNELLQILLSFGSSDYFARYLNRIITRSKFTDRCPAGKRAVAVNPDYKLYPCSGFFGNENYTCNSFSELLKKEKNLLLKTNLFSARECEECPIRYYCGGPCEDWKSKLNITSIESVNYTECAINLIYFRNAVFFISKLCEKKPKILKNYVKEKGIENRLSYPMNFEDFVLFFS